MRVAAILIIVLAAFVRPAKAEPITYTLTAVGSGTLGSASFSNETFTITSTANTANITESAGPFNTSIYMVPGITSTVSVAGLGIATFTVPTEDLSTTGLPGSFAFTAEPPNSDDFYANLLGVATSGLSGYNLSTSIGPLTGSPQNDSGTDFGTTVGNFDLTSVTSDTFQARLVPEPGSFTFLGLGALFLGCKREKRL